MKKQNTQVKVTIKQLSNTMIFVMPEHDLYHVLEENEDIAARYKVYPGLALRQAPQNIRVNRKPLR